MGTITNPYKKHPAEIVLRGLVLGRDVEIQGFQYRLVDGHLYIVGRRISGSTGEESEQLLGPNLSLDDFIRIAERMPADEIAGIAMDNTLTQEMQARVKQRKAYFARVER